MCIFEIHGEQFKPLSEPHHVREIPEKYYILDATPDFNLESLTLHW